MGVQRRSGGRSHRIKRSPFRNLTLSEQASAEYEQRNANLLILGFRDYKQYLRSAHWKSIRRAQLARQPQCYGCSKKASQVHHGHYSKEILAGETILGLYSICKRCHIWIEITRSGVKRGPTEATQELLRMKKILAVRRANAETKRRAARR